MIPELRNSQNSQKELPLIHDLSSLLYNRLFFGHLRRTQAQPLNIISLTLIFCCIFKMYFQWRKWFGLSVCVDPSCVHSAQCNTPPSKPNLIHFILNNKSASTLGTTLVILSHDYPGVSQVKLYSQLHTYSNTFHTVP